jgi:hypothetical protein
VSKISTRILKGEGPYSNAEANISTRSGLETRPPKPTAIKPQTPSEPTMMKPQTPSKDDQTKTVADSAVPTKLSKQRCMSPVFPDTGLWRTCREVCREVVSGLAKLIASFVGLVSVLFLLLLVFVAGFGVFYSAVFSACSDEE